MTDRPLNYAAPLNPTPDRARWYDVVIWFWPLILTAIGLTYFLCRIAFYGT